METIQTRKDISEMTEEDLYYSRILDEAIIAFRKNPKTITFEEWEKELEEEFGVGLSD